MVGRNIANKLDFFDGTKPHMAGAFVGGRFSLLGFKHRAWPTAPQTLSRCLKTLGFRSSAGTVPKIHEIAFAENATIEYQNVTLQVVEHALEIDLPSVLPTTSNTEVPPC